MWPSETVFALGDSLDGSEQTCGSPPSCESSPMFRDIDWSCHSFSGRWSPHNSASLPQSFTAIPLLEEQDHYESRPLQNSAALTLDSSILQANLAGRRSCFALDHLDSDHDHRLSPVSDLVVEKEKIKKFRSTSTSSNSDEASPPADDDMNRNGLNLLERARRDGLKSNYHRLRDVVCDPTPPLFFLF